MFGPSSPRARTCACTQVIDDPAGSKLLLVMEFMEGGPVLTREALEKRERLPETLALQYFRDMVKVCVCGGGVPGLWGSGGCSVGQGLVRALVVWVVG